MPVWKIYTPTGAYSDDDKRTIWETVSNFYAQIPIAKF
ncbi:hypothetical protein ACVWWN_006247 [Mycobacterium sp. URHB0021]|jgi:hypothetical protein